jgi:hypothetical protein
LFRTMDASAFSTPAWQFPDQRDIFISADSVLSFFPTAAFDASSVLLTVYFSFVKWLGEAVSPLSSSSLLPLGPILSITAQWADALGQDVETFRVLLMMFLSYPFGIVFSALPPGNSRHICGLIAGIVGVQIVYGEGWIHPLFTSSVVYAVLYLTWGIRSLDHVRHHIAWIFMMCYMSALHCWVRLDCFSLYMYPRR